MQIRHVRRRSLLRFNGRIKLIQIYMPVARVYKAVVRTRLRRVRPILRPLLPQPACPRELGLHRVGVDLSLSSLARERERERYLDKRDQEIQLVFSRGPLRELRVPLGALDTSLSRLTFLDIMEPLMLHGITLCVGRPDFRTIPRRTLRMHSPPHRTERVRHSCICAIRWIRGKIDGDASPWNTIKFSQE